MQQTTAPRRVIDTHVHVWKADAPWMKWLDDRPPTWDPVRRDFGFDELVLNLDQAAVAEMMLVQAGTDVRETRELLRLAAGERRVRGVIGWVSLRDPETTERHLAELASADAHGLLKGVRNNHRWTPDGDILESPRVLDACRVLEERDLRFDIHVEDDRDLPLVLKVAEAVPGLTVVLDHLGKPRIAEGRCFDDWTAWIRRLAELPNVYVKYSGWSTFLERAEASAVAPYITKVIQMFGSPRVMYGGNWPVALVTAAYLTTFEASLRALEDCSPTDLENIFHRTAAACYRLGEDHEEVGA